MEDQRRAAAEKQAASRRATAAQLLEDAERLIAAWNGRQGCGPASIACRRGGFASDRPEHRVTPLHSQESADTTSAAAGASVLKAGVVNGMPYTLFSDGSIEAQLPEGTLRFGSIPNCAITSNKALEDKKAGRRAAPLSRRSECGAGVGANPLHHGTEAI